MEQSRSPIAKSGVRSGRGLLQQFEHGPASDVRGGLTSHSYLPGASARRD